MSLMSMHVGGSAEQVSFTPLEVAHFARTLAGCVFGSTDPFADITFLAEQYRAGALDLNALVTSRIGLDGVADAFAQMAAGQGARSLVVLEGTS